tara:strand:- start:5462 stop:5668 length:207 start_codon:yes stop_codon:yes gene_type:complete
MMDDLKKEINDMLRGIQNDLMQSQKLMIQSIIGLCSVILARLHEGDIEGAKNSVVSLITQLEARSEDA